MEIYSLNEAEGMPEGLSCEDAAKLTEEGKVNQADDKIGKSYFKIVADNLFTYFNLIWLIITLLLVATKSYANLTFLAIVIPNALISTVQEIRAKKTVEKISVTTEPKASVVRGGELLSINAKDIVLGDVIYVEIGRQVPSDAVVISGLAEANESMLTGESDAIRKEEGSRLLAGSFLVSGSVYARVVNVGRDNYIHKIEKAAKSFSAPQSNLFRDLNRLIKLIGMFLIPMGLANFFLNYFVISAYSGNTQQSIIKTCGSIVGMIPSGIYLLVTLTLTLSVITLSKKNTLVQDMYSIEMLASADVLCLDKTGTITDGTMLVTDYVILDGTSDEDFHAVMSALNGSERSANNTSEALIERFGRDVSRNVLKKVPFSSKRKYSAADIEEIGIYSVGAPGFVPAPVSDEMNAYISSRAKEGERVLLVAKHDDIDNVGAPLALISISDRIRPNAKETIADFQEQGVILKVISGDNAETVSTIAARVGIKDADKYVSCESITDEELILSAEKYAVFGRVTPEQKVILIKTLKTNGHVVAMTGDGVNDTLALKESNCAIAMADGSEVARKISQIVLLGSDFGTLPAVVREGRRCINNVSLSSVLFLMKTLFTIVVSLLGIITLSGFPFAPNQFMMLEMFVIGLPSLLISLEPNNERIKGSFLESSIARSIPNAIALIAPVFVLIFLEKLIPGVTMECRNSIAMAVVTLVGFINLMTLCTPYTKWRGIVVGGSGILIGTGIFASIRWLGDMFDFAPILHEPIVFIGMLTGSILVAVTMQIFRGKIEKFFHKAFMRKRLARQNRISD